METYLKENKSRIRVQLKFSKLTMFSGIQSNLFDMIIRTKSSDNLGGLLPFTDKNKTSVRE